MKSFYFILGGIIAAAITVTVTRYFGVSQFMQGASSVISYNAVIHIPELIKSIKGE